MTLHSRSIRGGTVRAWLAAAVVLVCGVVTGSRAHAQLAAQQVATGLGQPLGVVSIPGDTGRLFIVEQVGRIRILNLATNTLVGTAFLDLSAAGLNLTAASGERGLLGLAFDPDYVTNGYFYVNYTSLGTPFDTRIERFRATGAPFANQAAAFAAATANPASRATLLVWPQDFTNHNGGDIVFGPDEMLYIGLGDGGNANDPLARAQNTATLLGKMLRIDVKGADGTPGTADDDDFPADANLNYAIPTDNPWRNELPALGGNLDPRPEIWATGKRNPWRFSFDRQTGDLWIADVGQDSQEEINFQPALTPGNLLSVRGRNYGWRVREGTRVTGLSGCACNTVPFTDPIRTYLHTAGACSVTGGYVYRGSAIPAMQGAYFHADYCAQWVRSFRYDGVTITDDQDWTIEFSQGNSPISGIAAIGEDAAGELYIVSVNLGRVYKIVPSTAVTGCAAILDGTEALGVEEFFEADNGWTGSGLAAATGLWQRGVPVNDPNWGVAPSASPSGTGSCWLTGNINGNSDVDNGSTTLTSPVMDWSFGEIEICYDYYLFLDQTGGASPDGLFFEISNNGGSTWTRVVSHTASFSNSWRSFAINSTQFQAFGITPNNNMRVRFIASDNTSPNQSTVEAGLDNFRVYTTNGDFNCNSNGYIDSLDISRGTSADCNANLVPDECDITNSITAAILANNENLKIDLDGGPVGNRCAGEAFFASCAGCHASDGTGGTGPNIRNKDRVTIKDRLTLAVFHPGGGFPSATAQDFANIEAFLADGGSRGRPDGIIDSCQTGLPNCDGDGVTDARELQLGTQFDGNYDGLPDTCDCPSDVNDSGSVDADDIFAYLNLWFAALGPCPAPPGSPCPTDVDRSCTVDADDIFAFLNGWFGELGACP